MNLRSAWFGAGLVLAGCGGAFTFDHGGDSGAAGAGGGDGGSERDASSSGASGDASTGGAGGTGGAAGRGGTTATGGGGTSSGAGGHGGAVTGGGAGVLSAGAAGVGTGGTGMGGTRDGGFGGRPDAAADAARADAAFDAAADVRPADVGVEAAAVDVTACTGPGQCAAVLRTCCATCTTPEASSYVGMNEAYAGAYRTSTCGRALCPAIACPLGSGDGSNPNIGAQCVMGHCEVFDVRRVPQFSGCLIDSDCTMRAGVGCCECTSAAWVGVSSSGRRALATAMCSPATRCLACIPAPPAGQQALCQGGTCLLSP